MNFSELESSKFYKMGRFRIDNTDPHSEGIRNIKPAILAGYDAIESNIENEIIRRICENSHKSQSTSYMNIMNLRQCLIQGDDFIPSEFRYEIYQQLKEMNSIFYRLGHQPKLVRLLIQSPSTSPGLHAHKSKQTLTFAYFYEENKIDSGKESSFTLVSEGIEYNVSIPNDIHRMYFNFPDGQPHNVWSHRWAFYWYADYEQDIIIPNDVNFTYLDLSK